MTGTPKDSRIWQQRFKGRGIHRPTYPGENRSHTQTDLQEAFLEAFGLQYGLNLTGDLSNSQLVQPVSPKRHEDIRQGRDLDIFSDDVLHYEEDSRKLLIEPFHLKYLLEDWCVVNLPRMIDQNTYSIRVDEDDVRGLSETILHTLEKYQGSRVGLIPAGIALPKNKEDLQQQLDQLFTQAMKVFSTSIEPPSHS